MTGHPSLATDPWQVYRITQQDNWKGPKPEEYPFNFSLYCLSGREYQLGAASENELNRWYDYLATRYKSDIEKNKLKSPGNVADSSDSEDEAATPPEKAKVWV